MLQTTNHDLSITEHPINPCLDTQTAPRLKQEDFLTAVAAAELLQVRNRQSPSRKDLPSDKLPTDLPPLSALLNGIRKPIASLWF